MKHFLSLLVATMLTLNLAAQPHEQRSLDADHPILLKEGAIHYDGRIIPLSERAIYIDGSLSDAEADRLPHVYNTFQKAAAAFVAGTEEQPMRRGSSGSTIPMIATSVARKGSIPSAWSSNVPTFSWRV